MTPTLVGIGCSILLLLLIALRVHIGIALSVAAVTGTVLIRGWTPGLSLLGVSTFDFVSSWSLTAIPMFILMGTLAHHSGLTKTLFAAAKAWLSFLPGGLAIATNISSAGFAAASGSSVAMAGAMSRVAVPEMLEAKYDPGLATGIVAVSGTLGAFIPPSIPFIIYGIFMEASIGKLLIAGIVPGLLTMFGHSLFVMLRVLLKPELAPRTNTKVPTAEKWKLLLESWPLPLIIAAVIGGLYTGAISATEAGAFGSIIALFAALLRRTLNWETLKASLFETVTISAAIFLIAMGAVMFSQMLSLSGIPATIGRAMSGNATSLWTFLLFVTIFYLILGMFLDAIGLMLVTLPIVQPFLGIFGIDVIWFGVLVVKLVEIGLLTPPIGLNLFVVNASVGKIVPFSTIVKGTSQFLSVELLILLILMLFPMLSLFLPNQMG